MVILGDFDAGTEDVRSDRRPSAARQAKASSSSPFVIQLRTSVQTGVDDVTAIAGARARGPRPGRSVASPADQSDGTVTDVHRVVSSLEATAEREASAAAITSSQNASAEATRRIDRLRRNADTLRRPAGVCDTCDLAAARALGS